MAALMGAGTFAVHQLRFALPFDHGTGARQAVDGHGYLVALGPVLAGLLLVACASALARVARGAVEPAPRFRRLWAGASTALLAVYCAQESTEALLTAHHPGLVDNGGWVALPLAVAVGLAIALITRGAAAATALAARRAPWHAPAPAAALEALLPAWAPRSTRASSRHLAARGPPAVSVVPWVGSSVSVCRVTGRG
jgi:hypothetical protein